MFNRREFIRMLTLGSAAAAISSSPAAALLRRSHTDAYGHARFKAVVFDAYTILDPRPIFGLVEKFFPGQGVEFGRVWRNKQFDYAWLHLLEGHYKDFWSVTQDALYYSANMLKVDLTSEKRDALLHACLNLKPWPDVVSALGDLMDLEIKLAFLSNFTPMMLQSNLKSSGLGGAFDAVISTGMAHTYKPTPQAYQLAINVLGISREHILYAPFAGWDTAGAKAFGLKTFWVDRIDLPPEELDTRPDATGATLDDVVKFVRG